MRRVLKTTSMTNTDVKTQFHQIKLKKLTLQIEVQSVCIVFNFK